jgi:ribosomal protein S18 acetylase RimI-like enzyme
MSPTVRLRPEEPADEALVRAVYASTRAEEMAMLPDWPEAAKQAFIDHQFGAQRSWYRQIYPQASWQIIEYQGAPAGRLYIDRRPGVLHIIDITLLPPFRGRGLGSELLQRLQAEAAAAGQSVRIHVERQNPALHLYQRLGFQSIDDGNPVYLLMEWKAPPTP